MISTVVLSEAIGAYSSQNICDFQKLSNATYRIQHTLHRNQQKVIHFDRLKPCPMNMRLDNTARQQTSSRKDPQLSTSTSAPEHSVGKTYNWFLMMMMI